MKKADKRRLLFIVSIGFILFLAGCVDTNVTNIPTTIDYRSEVNVVNLVAGMGSANVTMKEASGATLAGGETISYGDIALGDESPSNAFKDVPAGIKTVYISYSSSSSKDTIVSVNTNTNFKMRLFLIGDNNTSRTITKMAQRYISSTKEDTILFPKNIAQVAFMNGSPDDTVSYVGMVSGTDTSQVDLSASPLTMGTLSNYEQVAPKQYTFYVVSQSGQVAKQSGVTLSSQGRYTAIIYDYSSNLKIKILTDD